MSRVGIREVAAAAGVSITTVSKAFNVTPGARLVADATMKKIHDAAHKLNYTPNYGATLLRGQSSMTIGFSISLPEEVSVSFLSEYPMRIINGLGPSANKHGYQLLLINGTDYSCYMDIKRIDALVMLSYQHVSNPRQQEMEKMFHRFDRLGYPYVIINNNRDELSLPSINCDNRAGMRLIADLILRKDYASVGFLGELTRNPQKQHRDRLKDLQEFLSVRPGLLRSESVLNGSAPGVPDVPRLELYNKADGWAGLHYLVERKRLPRCLVCGDDEIASGALAACLKLGIRVPEELAVIGFDGSPNGLYSTPALTTVKQPLEEFGQMAFDYINRKIADPEYREVIMVPPTLIERSSS